MGEDEGGKLQDCLAVVQEWQAAARGQDGAADFVERVWESREKLIGQDIAGMARDIKPALVVAGPTGSLWDTYSSTQAEDRRSQAVNHRATAYSPGR